MEALKISDGDGPEVGVGEGYHFLESFPIAFLPTVQKLGDFVRDRWFGHEGSVLPVVDHPIAKKLAVAVDRVAACVF